MTKLVYHIPRTALKGEMTNLETKLGEANTDLDKFKDVSISMHDHNTLLVILATQQDIIKMKILICDEKLKQL